MSRAPLDYTARRAPSAASGFDVDQPVAGFFKMRMVSGGAFVGVRLWNGPPKDPVTGEELDRSWRWQAEANGSPVNLERVWPRCARDPISATEYAYLAARQDWAATNAPDSALADPRRKLDLLNLPLPY